MCGLGLAPSERSADTADLSDALGESFHSLVAWVAQSRTPVDQRLVALVGNLLILQNDASLLRSLRTQPENVAVEVLLYLIRAHIETDLGATNALRDDATKLLLSKLGGWSSVYEAMKLDPKLFNASNPIDVTCLLANVALEKRAEDSMLPVIVDALVSVLGEQSSVSGGCCACVSSLVESLIRCEDATEKTQKSSFDQFCDELGPRWRRSILYTDALLWVLVSLAEMVLRYPSKLAPLSLFGAVIGNSSDYVKVDCNQNPLVRATKEMVKLALNVMTTQNEPCVTLPSDQAIQRLSPLLLLRRIPRCYYASLADAQDVSQTAAREALYKEVAKEVAIRIGNDVGNETSAESYTVDERRLAAEIAPLLLPAEDLYRWVVFPTYALLTASVESPETCEAKQIPEIRAFRAAFYSGCHVIPFADTASEGNVLLKIASCSLSLLRREIPPTNGGECQEELSRLEAGCIDFLALCIQRLFEVDSCDSVTTTSVSPSRSKSRYPALDALRALHESLTAIALTGWDGKLVDTREGERAAVQYSILTRSRVWNSLLLVAKRCRVEHGHLQRFGAAFAPKTIEWGVSGPMDTSGRHPFCVAAAFQILLTLSVRSASSDWNVVASMDGSLLDQLISWSLSVARSSNRLNSPSTHEARMSAVKLLLSLLASGAFTTDDPNRRVPGQRLLEILSLVNSIAEDDPDAELQKLAVASIQVLRSSDEAQLAGMPTS